MKKNNWKQNTTLTHLGRDPDKYYGVVNPPIARTSTILYPDLAAYEDKEHMFRYGRTGNPMSEAFETSVAHLECGYRAVSTQTGLSAIITAIMSVIKSGDHILMVDTVYPNTRDFLSHFLPRFNIECEYYDPTIGEGIESLIRENTSLIYLESPGSATFEVQDIPAITKVAKAHNIITICDNTWSAGILLNPIQHGVNMVLQSGTKYIGGHSDINLGFVVADSEEVYTPLRQAALDFGMAATAEDMYLALRGLRTLTTRLKQNAQSCGQVIEWMKTRPEVDRIFYPADESHPTHDIWKRDFSGTNGLFSVLLKPAETQSEHDFVNALQLFPIGSSWGGYESLCQPQYLKSQRTAVPWTEEGRLLRFQVGMEDPEDLIADFDQAFKKLKTV